MAVETVRVYVEDGDGDPIVGVLVRFFDETDTFVTQQYTSLVGGEAVAEVGLDGSTPPVDYTIRLSKNGVAFDGSHGDLSKTPQAIEVYSPPAGSPTGTNYFQVIGETFERPAAIDPRLCRCSGFFVDPMGRPLRDLALHLSQFCPNDNQAPYAPLIVDGDAVLGDKVLMRTDADGYVVMDLYRTGLYYIYIAGLGVQWRAIHVPDSPSWNLVDLIFPVVRSISFDPDPVTVEEGDSVEVEVFVLASDGRMLDPRKGDVVFTSSNTGIATVQLSTDNKLIIAGVAAGTAQIEATVTDTFIRTIPEEPVTYAPLGVTVT